MNKQRDELESLQQQIQEERMVKQKEADAQKRLRRENSGLQEHLIESNRREADLGAKQRQMVKFFKSIFLAILETTMHQTGGGIAKQHCGLEVGK